MPRPERYFSPFLCDGVTESELCAYRERFSRDIDQSLSLLSDAVKAADPAVLASDLSAHRAAFRNALSSLCTDVKRHAARIPLPRSIFLGEAERKPAFTVACRLLSGLESERAAFLKNAAELSALHSQIREKRQSLAQASAALLCAAGATDGKDVQTRLQALQEALSAHAEILQGLSEKTEREDALQTDFCRRTFADFLSRMGSAADLENGGASCDPRAILRLCGELSALIEALLKH